MEPGAVPWPEHWRSRSLAFLRALGILILVTVTLITAYKNREGVVREIAAHSIPQKNDGDRFLAMAPQFLVGQAVYTNDRFPTPPITVIMLAPLTWLTRPNAQVLWVCIKPIFAGLIFWLGMNMLRRAGCRLSPLATTLIIAAWFWPAFGDMQEEQLNLLMLLPLTAALWAAQLRTRRMDALAGVLLGLAICIKVTPVIFILYFAWRRRWRVLVGTLAGSAFFLVIIPSAVFGAERNLQLLIGWAQIMILPYVAHGQVDYANGVSVPSFLTRLLRHIPAFVSEKSGHTVEHFINVANLPVQSVERIIRGVLLGILAAGLFWMRRPLPDFKAHRYIFEVGAVATFMLWASERTWVAHYVTLLLPLLAVGLMASHPAYSFRARWWAMWALAAAAFDMYMTSDISKVLAGPDGRQYVEMINMPLWASVVLMLCIVGVRPVNGLCVDESAAYHSIQERLALVRRDGYVHI